MKPTLILLVLFFAACASNEKPGDIVDRHCIKGRLTETDAQLLNQAHPSWATKPAGAAVEDDRVLNRDCSELIKAISEEVGIK